MLFGEFIIADAISSGILAVKARPTLLEQFMEVVDPARVADFGAWLAPVEIPVFQGYPREGARSPSVGILTETQQEILDVLGDTWISRDGGDAQETIKGIRSRTSWTAIIVAEGDAAAYLAGLVYWSLIVARARLQAYGFEEQSLAMRSLLPLTAGKPSWAWSRAVVLSAAHNDVYVYREEATQINSVEVDPTWNEGYAP